MRLYTVVDNLNEKYHHKDAKGLSNTQWTEDDKSVPPDYIFHTVEIENHLNVSNLPVLFKN